MKVSAIGVIDVLRALLRCEPTLRNQATRERFVHRFQQIGRHVCYDQPRTHYSHSNFVLLKTSSLKTRRIVVETKAERARKSEFITKYFG